MTVVSGERLFACPPEELFDILLQPEVVLAPLPAVHSHRSVGPDAWEAKVKAPVPLLPSVSLHIRVAERRPPEHASMTANGPGADVRSTFDLRPDGNGGTVMHWETEVHLHGLLRPLGGHALDGVARHQAERALDAVERELTRRTGPA